VGKPLIFSIRPEHITEPRGGDPAESETLAVTLDVVEPMGMDFSRPAARRCAGAWTLPAQPQIDTAPQHS
jgi:hypothetical protein